MLRMFSSGDFRVEQRVSFDFDKYTEKHEVIFHSSGKDYNNVTEYPTFAEACAAFDVAHDYIEWKTKGEIK